MKIKVQFFEESKTAKMTYNERIESLELNKLLNQIIDKEKTIKTNIRTNQYTAVIFQKERNNPYTSHFYIAQELESYLGSLELNFFISKYNEMSNKSGKKVSIYALNYGLCMDENLRWGKPLQLLKIFCQKIKKYIVKTVCMSLAKKSII